jgi:hypothetical protein
VTTPEYVDLAARLVIDIAAIFICAYAIYYRRHRRRDLLTAYTAYNIGLFVVVAVITVRPVGAAVGFGLFALLSIIRLRSEPFSNSEISYFFVTLVLGLINGLAAHNLPLAVALDAIVLMAVYVVDHPRLLTTKQGQQKSIQRQRIVLDTIHRDEPALRADLERRLGVEIQTLTVNEIDYVREIMVVDIRHTGRPDAGTGEELPRLQLAPEPRAA